MDRLRSWFRKPEPVPEGTRAPLPFDRRVGGFRLGQVLGDGGTATVYEATVADGDEAVVKIPHLGPLQDREFVETFKREAEIGVSLRHPSIVKVLEAGTYDAEGQRGIPYIAMERLRGRDLASTIQEEGPLDPERAARVARGIADALEWAHHRGVVHRDITPSNVFLTQQRGVKVMDFGISAASWDRRKGARGMSRGTPEYLAPERIENFRLADPGVDLYALGCVLYEMLSGHPPFRSDRPEEVLRMHRSDPVPPLEGRLLPGLGDVVQRLLEKDPRRRYQAAREVLVDLAEVVSV